MKRIPVCLAALPPAADDVAACWRKPGSRETGEVKSAPDILGAVQALEKPLRRDVVA